MWLHNHSRFLWNCCLVNIETSLNTYHRSILIVPSELMILSKSNFDHLSKICFIARDPSFYFHRNSLLVSWNQDVCIEAFSKSSETENLWWTHTSTSLYGVDYVHIPHWKFEGFFLFCFFTRVSCPAIRQRNLETLTVEEYPTCKPESPPFHKPAFLFPHILNSTSLWWVLNSQWWESRDYKF